MPSVWNLLQETRIMPAEDQFLLVKELIGRNCMIFRVAPRLLNENVSHGELGTVS